MTNKEIKKALECCINDDCDNCPDTFGNCEHNAMRNALDLINRQQSAIDVYMQENDRLKTAYIQVSMDRDEMRKKITDFVEVETIKSWLYEMALNNVGCHVEGDFSNACEEIISRLEGLKRYSTEKEGADNG
jgi:hypothetical protein